MTFFTELKRRNVIRMAGLYLVGAWLLVQVAGTVLPMFDAPVWLPRSIVILIAIGFVPALIFSWVFELTPEGLKRDEHVKPEDSIAPQTARRMDRMIIVVLVLALTYFGFDKFVLAPRRDAALVAATAKTSAHPTQGQAISRKSIAVLPFTDLSPDHDQEYFSDGIAEEILGALTQVRDLKVAGRTSSFYFKGKNEKLSVIGQALGVANILEGSVRKQDNKVRISVQLIQTADGFQLWSENYDGEMTDVFELQERIARAITDQLKVVLEGAQKTRLAQRTTLSVEAYQQYLRGRYFWNRRGLVNLQNAVTAFKAALTADPDYADAWAGLAQTYALIPEYSASDPAGNGQAIDTVSEALDAAEHALRLEPASSRALSARAYVRCVHQFDWAGAEADYRAAIAGDPRDSTARHWYGELLAYQRRWPEAAVQYDAAIALDPLAPINQLSKGLSLWFKGDPAAALPYFDESLRLAPGFYLSMLNKLAALAVLHRFDEAMVVVRDLPGGSREVMSSFMAAMQDASRKEAAAQELIAHGPSGVTGKARMLAMLGENELALAELERLFAQHDPYRVYLYAIPEFDPLHQDPRFQALLNQIGLPPKKDSKEAQSP